MSKHGNSSSDLVRSQNNACSPGRNLIRNPILPTCAQFVARYPNIKHGRLVNLESVRERNLIRLFDWIAFNNLPRSGGCNG